MARLRLVKLFALVAAVCVLASASALPTRAVHPGMQIGFSTDHFDDLMLAASNAVANIADRLAVPDITGTASTSVGDVDYDVVSIMVEGIRLPSVTYSESGGNMKVTVSNADCEVTFAWIAIESAWPHVHDKGLGTVQVSDSTLVFYVELYESGGKLVPKVVKSTCVLGSLDIDIDSSISWIYNMFVSLFKSKIVKSIETEVTTFLSNLIDEASASYFAGLPMTAALNLSSTAAPPVVDLALLANPTIASSYISAPLSGAWLFANGSAAPAETPESFNDNTDFSSDLSLWVADSSLNSMGAVLADNGFFNTEVTEFPSWSPIQLDTFLLRDLIPDLYAAYPNKTMAMGVSPLGPPSFNISRKSNITMDVDLALAFTITGTETAVFTLGAGVAANLYAETKNNADVVVAFSALAADITLLQSKLASFPTTTIGQIVTFALDEGGGRDQINAALADAPFPLWTEDGIATTGAGILFGDGFMKAFTDFKYSIPGLTDYFQVVLAALVKSAL